jgi:hypothetical protein
MKKSGWKAVFEGRPFPDGETLGKHPTGQPKCTRAKKTLKLILKVVLFLTMSKLQDTILTEEKNKRLMLKVILFQMTRHFFGHSCGLWFAQLCTALAR